MLSLEPLAALESVAVLLESGAVLESVAALESVAPSDWVVAAEPVLVAVVPVELLELLLLLLLGWQPAAAITAKAIIETMIVRLSIPYSFAGWMAWTVGANRGDYKMGLWN